MSKTAVFNTQHYRFEVPPTCRWGEVFSIEPGVSCESPACCRALPGGAYRDIMFLDWIPLRDLCYAHRASASEYGVMPVSVAKSLDLNCLDSKCDRPLQWAPGARIPSPDGEATLDTVFPMFPFAVPLLLLLFLLLLLASRLV